MRGLIKQDGFNFAFDPRACESCASKCCAGESGDVFASDDEIAAIAAFLGEDETATRGIYFRKARNGWLAKERQTKRGFECVFLGANGCEIYAARPAQCRTFPFWNGMNERLDWLAQECLGAVI
ncbi:MAG: YkgJ family cysteine cluster protein [Helicobacteraceae bacterium]|jgi:Fe-S-cluster containining protein|nr:YkgJ family cysteine cluster protein [Helicobacteraceae bacterium]